MELKIWMVFLIVFHWGGCISISSNGKTPQRKMLSIDSKSIEFGGFIPINPIKYERDSTIDIRDNYLNNTILPVNERYRRLIPYMTFYLANGYNNPHGDSQNAKVKYQKVAIPEDLMSRPQSGKVTQFLPHYQGNRYTPYSYQDKQSQGYYQNPYNSVRYSDSEEFLPIHGVMRAPVKQNVYSTRKPIPVPVKVSNVYSQGGFPGLQYYSKPTEEPKRPQYKLVPYEQTPPVQVPTLHQEEYYVPKYYEEEKNNVPVQVESVPLKLEQHYDEIVVNNPEQKYRYNIPIQYLQKIPTSPDYVSPVKNYIFKKPVNNINPTTDAGFQPIIHTTSSPKYTHITSESYISVQPTIVTPDVTTGKPYYKVNPTKIANPDYKYNQYTEPAPNYGLSNEQYEQNNLAMILKSLQEANSLPQTITEDNVDSSIKTLVQILKNLKGAQKYVDSSTIKPIMSTPIPFQAKLKPVPIYKPTLVKPQIQDYPPQNLEIDHVVEPPILKGIETSQSYPAEQDDVGGTPGRFGIDYPALATIPKTSFDCKTQRYKGFFGDPETNCQVWHYCDLNGGQASFLCPNGTIFSQVALTCDWWFNVKCSTTTQLYVLNERLYKYILPFSPKFPEDYSGPLVDKYLAIKYKEMEEKMKKKKKVSMPETTESDTVDKIEIKNSGMSGALRPYDN